MITTVTRVRDMAYLAHRGQVDKLGKPYTLHLDAVAYGVEPFGEGMEMAAYLHDIVEDTKTTLGHLQQAGVPASVIHMVQALTHDRGEAYTSAIRRVCGNYGACLIKIADNAHNTLPERMAQLDGETRYRLEEKYRKARQMLWPSVAYTDARLVLGRVNARLMPLLDVEMGQ